MGVEGKFDGPLKIKEKLTINKNQYENTPHYELLQNVCKSQRSTTSAIPKEVSLFTVIFSSNRKTSNVLD